MKHSNNLEKKDSLRHLLKNLASKNVQPQSSLEPPQEYNQGQMPLTDAFVFDSL